MEEFIIYSEGGEEEENTQDYCVWYATARLTGYYANVTIFFWRHTMKWMVCGDFVVTKMFAQKVMIRNVSPRLVSSK